MSQEVLAWDAGRDVWQSIRNERPIPPRRAQVTAPAPVPVVARIVWARDGVEHHETVAWAWTTRAVLVELHDRRCQTIGVWLPRRDVTRRPLAGRERSHA